MRVAALVCAVLALGSGRAVAESTATTDAFVALTSRAYAVLQDADRLAETGRGSAFTRGFARRDANVQARAAGRLAEWARALQAEEQAAAHAPSLDHLGPIFYPYDAVILPFDVHGQRATQADRAVLAQLAGSDGPAFDSLYDATATKMLEALARTYEDYIRNGDSPDLRRLSVTQLPVVRGALARLTARSAATRADR